MSKSYIAARAVKPLIAALRVALEDEPEEEKKEEEKKDEDEPKWEEWEEDEEEEETSPEPPPAAGDFPVEGLLKGLLTEMGESGDILQALTKAVGKLEADPASYDAVQVTGTEAEMPGGPPEGMPEGLMGVEEGVEEIGEGEPMEPTQISAKLNQIADTIDRSKNPQKHLVVQDLNRVLASIKPYIKTANQPPFGHGGGRPGGPAQRKPDGTGPCGQGPQTGLGLGPCAEITDEEAEEILNGPCKPPFGHGGGRPGGPAQRKPDGTGPRGEGPQTGLGLGPCSKMTDEEAEEILHDA